MQTGLPVPLLLMWEKRLGDEGYYSNFTATLTTTFFTLASCLDRLAAGAVDVAGEEDRVVTGAQGQVLFVLDGAVEEGVVLLQAVFEDLILRVDRGVADDLLPGGEVLDIDIFPVGLRPALGLRFGLILLDDGEDGLALKFVRPDSTLVKSVCWR